MHRSPSSPRRGTGRLSLFLAALAAVGLAACDGSPADPAMDDALEPGLDEELELVTDPLLAEGVLQEVRATLGPEGASDAAGEMQQAEALFAEARAAHRRGDPTQALSLGREARRSLARAMLQAGGPALVDEALARVEFRARSLESMQSRTRVQDRIREARGHRHGSEHLRAGEGAVHGMQEADRERRREEAREHRDSRERALLAVSMAREAVSLANRLLDEQADPAEVQERLLAAAEELAALAADALSEERREAAVAAGHRAVDLALMAVILPEIDREDVEQVDGGAVELLTEARAHLAENPDELLQRILDRAERLYLWGTELVDEGNLRGLCPTWRAGILAAVVLP